MGGAWHFLSTSSVVTGSTAEMSAPNMNASADVSGGIRSKDASKMRTPPVAKAATSVPPIASSKMAMKLEKKPLRCVLTPASKMIGGSKPKNRI